MLLVEHLSLKGLLLLHLLLESELLVRGGSLRTLRSHSRVTLATVRSILILRHQVHVVLNLLGLEAAAQVISVVYVQFDLAVGSLVLVSDLIVVFLVIIVVVIIICWVTVHLVASDDVINNLARLSIVAIFKCVMTAMRLLAILLIAVVLVHVLVLIRILHINHLVPVFNDIVVVLVRGHCILHFVAHLIIQM